MPAPLGCLVDLDNFAPPHTTLHKFLVSCKATETIGVFFWHLGLVKNAGVIRGLLCEKNGVLGYVRLSQLSKAR